MTADARISTTAYPALRRFECWALALLIAVHGAFLTVQAAWNSATFDETAHLAAGCAYWRYGDLSVYNLSPPLLRLWETWPAMLAGVDVPSPLPYHAADAENRSWYYNDAFQAANRDHYAGLFFWPRLTVALLSCVTVGVVFTLGREACGAPAGLAAAALYALNPDALAHGSLITTDTGLTLMMLVTMWLWLRVCRAPRLRNTLALALSAGCAVLIKHSALMLWPMMAAMAVPLLYNAPAPTWRRAVATWGGALVGAWLMINLAYGFGGCLESWEQQTLASDAGQVLQRLMGHFPLLLPHDFVEGFDAQLRQGQNFINCFLLGERFLGWRWYYFPVVLGLKLPLAVIALLILAAWRWVRMAGTQRPKIPLLGLGAAAVVFLLQMVLFNHLDVGVRYLLPVYPLLFVFVSHLWLDPTLLTRRVATALLGLAVLEALCVAPQFLCFVNVLGGGATYGYLAVNDSNYDWGQDLWRLKKWQDENHVESIELDYFGAVDPALYGVRYTPGISGATEPLVGLSAYYLCGLGMGLPINQSRTQAIELPAWRYLAQYPPVARPGYSILIYRRSDIEHAMRAYFADNPTPSQPH